MSSSMVTGWKGLALLQMLDLMQRSAEREEKGHAVIPRPVIDLLVSMVELQKNADLKNQNETAHSLASGAGPSTGLKGRPDSQKISDTISEPPQKTNANPETHLPEIYQLHFYREKENFKRIKVIFVIPEKYAESPVSVTLIDKVLTIRLDEKIMFRANVKGTPNTTGHPNWSGQSVENF